MKSVEFTNGYSNTQPYQTDPGAEIVPAYAVFEPEDALDFKRKFKGVFPARTKELKMLTLTKNTKCIMSGVLHIEQPDDSSDKKVGLIGDIRIDEKYTI